MEEMAAPLLKRVDECMKRLASAVSKCKPNFVLTQNSLKKCSEAKLDEIMAFWLCTVANPSNLESYRMISYIQRFDLI